MRLLAPRRSSAMRRGRTFRPIPTAAARNCSCWKVSSVMSTATFRPGPISAIRRPLDIGRGLRPGCVLLVKLWQFDLADRTQVRIQTKERVFVPVADRDGVAALELFQDRHEVVRLERWAANATISLAPGGGAELLVIEGAFEENGERFETQSWLRLPPGASIGAQAGATGCTVWIKTGHLGRPVTLPSAIAPPEPELRYCVTRCATRPGQSRP